MASTSGLSVSICLTVTVLAVLFTTERAYAKRGCSAFGHSCFGGHGKRSDPVVRQQPTDDELASAAENQAYEAPRMAEELYLIGPEEERFQEVNPPTEVHRRNTVKIDPDALSLFVGQWLASHRRLHHPDQLEERNN